MEHFYQKISRQLEQKLPFVMYNKPNSNKLIGYFQKDSKLYKALDFAQSGFVFAPFNGNDVILIPEAHSEIIIESWQASGNILNAAVSPTDDGKSDFEKRVAKAVHTIQNGQFQKVVLSRKETVRVENFDVIALFQNLLETYPAAFTYCFFHPQVGMWFGASPEQLLKVRSDKFETTALAGTQKFTGIEEVDWEHKEKEEQQFVTDFILENLDNFTEDIAFTNPYTYKAGNLLHIKTDISGTLSANANVKQVLDILHPTPAVCGLPKDKAREFILENEGYDRKYYSGYLGEFGARFYPESLTDLFVNLRCMEIDGNSAVLYIGCGITKDSEPEKEYNETVNKSMTMKKILPIL